MPILGTIASSYLQATDLGAFVPIATTTVPSGGAAVVTYTSIPQTYTHLQVRILGRATGLERAEMRFNNDSGSTNYDNHRLYGDGSTASTDVRIDRSALWLASAGPIGITSTANYGTGLIIDILDYTSTNKYKVTKTTSGTDLNGSGAIEFTSGSWKNTAAITRIDLSIATYNWAQNTSIALYGLKG